MVNDENAVSRQSYLGGSSEVPPWADLTQEAWDEMHKDAVWNGFMQKQPEPDKGPDLTPLISAIDELREAVKTSSVAQTRKLEELKNVVDKLVMKLTDLS